MLEKIGHVKNPLTVIAMFAGLAEVSGAIVLPFLSNETQRIFVWFLMLFPCLLVGLFFLMLFTKHHALYAPSDFRDDKFFADLFNRAPASDRFQKIGDEAAAQAAAEAAATTEMAEGSLNERPNVREQSSDQSGESISEGENSRTQGGETNNEPPAFDAAKDLALRDLTARSFLSEELVLTKLSKDLNIKFERDINLRGATRTQFDALSISGEKVIIVEVKYSRKGLLPLDGLIRTFNNVLKVYSNLPDNTRRSFQFHLAITVENYNETIVRKLKEKILNIKRGYPYTTIIHIFTYDELERDAALKT
ncbi:hypothetical protein KTR66_22975 [Roseococcus sp. SDR]|uniref:hypothetical protein n=1 Tax=Roseococcus sp. SDR TaxID=2835532 RepID=UPI001BCFA3E2|nr:hypothetical protein [Roseococcus sp. SDR]MBS7792871.1 NERD domain-containing protein [Roseococcus sp. SDR]MBV1848185.1 hypothetical protein [Roseococcus sp. SDR]